MVPVQIMQASAHAPQTLGGIDKHCLRRVKALSRYKLPAKIFGVNANLHPKTVKLRLFHLCQEIAGVDKVKTVHLSLLLSGVLRYQRQKRMLLVRGLSPHGSDTLLTVSDLTKIQVAFSGPGALKRQHLVIFLIHIHACRHDFREENTFLRHIPQRYASDYHVHVRKNAVAQRCFQADAGILRHNLKR